MAKTKPTMARLKIKQGSDVSFSKLLEQYEKTLKIEERKFKKMFQREMDKIEYENNWLFRIGR